MPLATAKVVWFTSRSLLLVALVAMAASLPVERRKPPALDRRHHGRGVLKFYAHELVLGQVNVLFAVVATVCSWR